ncbi:MAG: toll/interleukin-1 receptor domain-containing protein [Proteobacteria bacterium]|nr:toll/interleukin-1 receptor domain-containing protein [Pseudomonadota bacterium]
MSTVREHYDLTAKALNAQREWHLRKGDDSPPITVLGKISHRLEENTKYWSFYIPPEADTNCVAYLLQQKSVVECYWEGEPDQVIGFTDSPERQSLSLFVFTKLIYLYIDSAIDDTEKTQIIQFGKSLGFSLRIRDRNYVKECDVLSKPLAFISHDSRDKDELVRELAFELSKLLCLVWYDEYSLKVGDSLSENIERGLKETKKCVVILSPNFLNNTGWGKAEFDFIYQRELIENKNIFLPVWHNVGIQEVKNYNEKIAGRLGLNSAEGVPTLARKLAEVIKNDMH